MTDRDPNSGRFVSGVSGNPKGRPKDELSVTALLDSVVTEQDWKAMFEKLRSMGLHGNIKAIELLLDRRFGKALQQTENHHTGDILLWDARTPPPTA